jgi:CheY-like chemotaxis protein
MHVRKILIIDDETGFTKIVKLTLEMTHNYKVFEENDPRKAVETAHRVSPDIILLDIVMPEVDGGDVLLQLKADPVLKDIPVVFVTAIVRKKEVDEHSGTIGGTFYISKPVTVDGLIRTIEDHLEES